MLLKNCSSLSFKDVPENKTLQYFYGTLIFFFSVNDSIESDRLRLEHEGGLTSEMLQGRYGSCSSRDTVTQQT